MKKNEIARQGDVLVKLGKIPEDAKETEETVLAYGEVTGHAHRINGDAIIFRVGPMTARSWIKSLTGFDVEHEEHETIHFPPGEYEFTQQREYDWYSEEVRRVAD
jgi:tRNA U34 2-thiouridine synthase MnmA/TrmU